MSQAPSANRFHFSWQSRAFRGVVYQLIALVLVIAGIWFLAHNTQVNMEARGIQSGFDFLESPAGFDIGERVIAYDPAQSYGRAIWVGVLNTLRVAVVGILLTTLIGVLIGVGRFSRNGLVRGFCYGYVEVFRNIPILLQLLMWYLIFLEFLPATRNALSMLDLFFLSKGGLAMPKPVWETGHLYMALGLVAGIASSWAWGQHARRKFEQTGVEPNRWLVPVVAVLACTGLGWWLGGAPSEWAIPEKGTFNVRGGMTLTPEFLTLVVGLTVYTSAFVAEVVRGGIASVSQGQSEAASALGLSPGQKMRLVILPQAMRVIIPPLTNQYLNLTKNSSLAVAVGYPDVVSVVNTTINQSGRAVECIAIIMLVYLSTSLLTSILMNIYNRRVAIQER